MKTKIEIVVYEKYYMNDKKCNKSKLNYKVSEASQRKQFKANHKSNITE